MFQGREVNDFSSTQRTTALIHGVSNIWCRAEWSLLPEDATFGQLKVRLGTSAAIIKLMMKRAVLSCCYLVAFLLKKETADSDIIDSSPTSAHGFERANGRCRAGLWGRFRMMMRKTERNASDRTGGIRKHKKKQL